MSLFGKLLAVVNLLGAFGLVYLASMTYGARQQWAYVVHHTNLMIDGLPVDHGQFDKQGQPLVDRIGDDTLRELFSKVGGNPVKTQVEEVQGHQGRINARVRELEANKRQQMFYLAGILLPMADSLLERDEYLAIQAHMSSDVALKALESRYVNAMRDAKREGASGPDRPFHQAFRLGVRSQGGAPSEALTSLIVENLPRDAKADVNIAKLFADAIESQRQGMVKKLERLFTEALTNAEQSTQTPPDGAKNSNDSQRSAIARLLMGLSVSQATEAIESNAQHAEKAAFGTLTPTMPGWLRVLAGTNEYQTRQRRVYVVCGVKTAINALSARSSTLRLLASQVDTAQSDERILFLTDDAALLEEARELAGRLRYEDSLKAENERKIQLQRDTIKLRGKDVGDAESDLKGSEEETNKAMTRLREETEKARQARVLARNRLTELADRERLIQELERQVLETQSKNR